MRSSGPRRSSWTGARAEQHPCGGDHPAALLFGITMIVVLIACANIANLLLARGADRAERDGGALLLGASRGQTLAQLLTESVLLARSVAWRPGRGALTLRRHERHHAAETPPRTSRCSSAWRSSSRGPGPRDRPVVRPLPGAARHAAGLVTVDPRQGGPALRRPRGHPLARRRSSRRRSGWRWPSSSSAGLFARSLSNVSAVDLGVQGGHVVTFGVSPELNGYARRARPVLPPGGGRTRRDPRRVERDRRDGGAHRREQLGQRRGASGLPEGAGHRQRLPLQRGRPRLLRESGSRSSPGAKSRRPTRSARPKVAVVNQAFARKFKLGANAVGQANGQGGTTSLDLEIVGLVQGREVQRREGRRCRRSSSCRGGRIRPSARWRVLRSHCRRARFRCCAPFPR